MFPYTATGQNVLDIVELFSCLYSGEGDYTMPTNWEEFEALRKEYVELEELYQQFF